MSKAKGTTLDNPVTNVHRPDLKSSYCELTEYLHNQGAYDLFEYLAKELATKMPEDPLQHMIDCLETPYHCGPLKVAVCSAPGIGREKVAKRLAAMFGLEYISAGELLRNKGVAVNDIAYADDTEVAELVMEQVKQATANMQGFLLDGFPRTKCQLTFLKQHKIAPTHVLVLKVPEEAIHARNQAIADGKIQEEGLAPLDPRALQRKISEYTAHKMIFQDYSAQLKMFETETLNDAVVAEMAKAIRTLPRSMAPYRPPRVIILAPRGVGVREHTSRLAARMGAVFISGADLASGANSEANSLGPIGERLRQEDCNKQGWIMCGFPTSGVEVQALEQDPSLAPIRIVALKASVETCVSRLRLRQTDPVTGQVWTARPKSEKIRKRLIRDAADQEPAVRQHHKAYTAALEEILKAFGNDQRCSVIVADGEPEAVHSDIVEFVERPLPLPVAQ